MTAGKKRGVFFTFISIIIIALFMLVFLPQTNVSLEKDTRAVNTRINSVNNYVNDLNTYLEDVLRATTRKTILSLIFYMNESGSYITNLNSTFYEVLVNGTINKVPIDSITHKAIMYNSTFVDLSGRLSETAEETLNVETIVNITNATLLQTSPWGIQSVVKANISVKSDVAEWKKTVIISASIDIEELYDPYYLVNTDGLYPKQIKRSNREWNKWNISHVREHLRNGTYVYWQNSDAPSFLMRLTNDMAGSSCCGIESLVDPNKITPNDQTESYVDYLFWTHVYNARCAELYNITKKPTSQGLWDEFKYFKLDMDHAAKYNITWQDMVVNCG